MMTVPEAPALPREDLARAMSVAPEFRDATEEGGRPTLVGHFAVFDQWTEINSMFEGNFLERMAPGTFAKTISENRSDMRVLFQHGKDPQLGDKPLGAITDLREDENGVYYEATLFDGIPPLIMDGLRAGQYGASFRFNVLRQDIVNPRKPTESNPDMLPERTVKEARVREFGPVTFPAYAGATAGMRSITDQLMLQRFLSDPDQFGRLIAGTRNSTPLEAEHLESAPPAPKASPTPDKRFRHREDYLEWLTSL